MHCPNYVNEPSIRVPLEGDLSLQPWSSSKAQACDWRAVLSSSDGGREGQKVSTNQKYRACHFQVDGSSHDALPDTYHRGYCQTGGYQEKLWGTAQSRPSTVAPAPSDRAEPVRPRATWHLHILSLVFWIGKRRQIPQCVNVYATTCIGMTTLMSPILTLDPWASNLTVKGCVSPQGRFFTLSNSTVKPEMTHPKG